MILFENVINCWINYIQISTAEYVLYFWVKCSNLDLRNSSIRAGNLLLNWVSIHIFTNTSFWKNLQKLLKTKSKVLTRLKTITKNNCQFLYLFSYISLLSVFLFFNQQAQFQNFIFNFATKTKLKFMFLTLTNLDSRSILKIIIM